MDRVDGARFGADRFRRRRVGWLLAAYNKATPAALAEHLTSPAEWTRIHPPLDVAFRALVNMGLASFIDSPVLLVRANQTVASLLVLAGIAGVCVGLWRSASRP